MAFMADNSTAGFVPMPSPDLGHGPMTRVFLWVMTSVSLVFLALRICCKVLKSRGLWYDDYMLVAAWVSSLPIQCYANDIATAVVAPHMAHPEHIESLTLAVSN